MLAKLFKHKLITGVILVLILAGSYLGYKNLIQKESGNRYVFAAVERGTLIVSVSGSGQVTVSDQVDIKPKASGDITALYIKKDQEVKAGQLLAVLDSSDAEKTIRDAEISLNDAQYSLEQAKKECEDIETEANRTLTNAYEDGYDAVSSAFFKLAGYMDNLQDTLGTEKSAEEYITGYELILGRDSSFTQKLLEDYDEASEAFNENFDFFRSVSREDTTSTIYQLIAETLATTKTISRALDSARHMFDAISLYNYEDLRTVASQIETMKPKIQSDVSAVYSSISSLQTVKDTIDDTNENTPVKIEGAQRAMQTAQNTVIKKEEALADAQKELAKYSVYAPFGGVITEINVEKGDSVSTGTVLAILITKQKIVEITLNEVDAAKVKTGQKVTLTFDALPDITASGKIFEVDTVGQVSQGVASYGVKISFDTQETEVKAGMSATADIITNAKTDVLVVPNGAIKSQGDVHYVELMETDSENTSQQLLANVSGAILSTSPKTQTVEVGLANDLYTEIISGLEEGDIVVSSTVNSNNAQTSQTRTTQRFGTPGGEVQMFFR